MVRFSDVLSRADAIVLQELLGAAAVRLLLALDPSNDSPSRLRKLLLELHEPQELLTRQQTRNLILEMLSPLEAEELAHALRLEGSRHVYSALASIRLSSRSPRYAELLRFFGLTLPSESTQEASPESEWIAANLGLFPHQRRALRKLRPQLTTAPRRAVLHMPTGAGKTRTTMHYVAEHLRQNEGKVVFWLASTEELCEQAAESFSECWSSLGNRSVELYRLWGGRPVDAKALNNGIVIASIASVRERHIRSGTWMAWAGDRTTLVILDEAHQAVAPSFKFVLETLLARRPDSQLIGLTATPGRTYDDVNEDMRLAEFFGRKKVAIEVPGYESPVEYLIDEGYLARPEFRTLEVESVPLADTDYEKLAGDLDVPESILRRLADDEVRSVKIVRAVEDLARRHSRIILFATTVDHAERLAAVLQATGIGSRSVTGKTDVYARSSAISWFKSRSSDVRVLTNFGVLTAGFDAPQTSAALIARPTKSLVLFSQMVGRATRGTRAGGNRNAEILTVVDTSLPGFGDMAQAFHNWEDVW